MRHLLAVILLFVVGAVQAAPLTWTINNATLISDYLGVEGTWTGSFDFDADTNVFSNVMVVSSWPAYTFWEDNLGVTFTNSGGLPSPLELMSYEENMTGLLSMMYMNFDSPLTNAGGVIGISTSSWQSGGNGTDAFFDAPGATVSAVPIPAAVWLFASGLGLLGWMRRRRLS